MQALGKNQNLIVFKASAGSGKTHTIARQFLKFTLADDYPDNFAKILAVTFTNKASEEMKVRIIQALNDTIKNGSKSSYLDQNLKKIPDNVLRQRALRVRSEILHGYTFFTVKTIDSFIQRVVRSFAYELRLPANFKIQLDDDLVASVIYLMLMEKISLNDDPHTKDLKQWLLEFMLTRIDEKGTWNFSGDIQSITKLLFDEQFIQIKKRFGKSIFSIDKLQSIKQKINQIIAEYRRQSAIFRKRFLQLTQDIIDTKPSNKSAFHGILKFFTADEALDLDNLTQTAKKYLGLTDKKSKLFTTNELKITEYQNFIATREKQLKQLALEAIDFVKNHFKTYQTALTIRQNLYLMGIFNDLLELVEQYRYRFNEFLISDLTVFLREIIAGSQAPFIYERIGQRYENILIDEFQDTSRFQWDNFRPLIHESLSHGKQSMIVGDVKQAIYRWRGGDWRILLEEIEQEFKNYVYDINQGQQSTNWRSAKNIVQFNNLLFKLLPELVQNSFLNEISSQTVDQNMLNRLNNIIIKAYSDAQQKVSKLHENHFGRVEIHFLHDEDQIFENIFDTIRQLKSEGYNFSDIAFLVRKNDQATLIAQALVEFRNKNPEYDLSVLSNESLFLVFSPAVQLIVNLLKYIVESDEYFLKLAVFNYYQLKQKSDNSIDNKTFTEILLADKEQLISKFLPENFTELIENLNQKTLFDIVQQIISFFDLQKFKSQYAYLRSFEDVVIDFIYEKGSDIRLFLQVWEQEAKDLSINISETHSAIRILTIHKAKGLDFPVVIIPFADWKLDEQSNKGKIIWAKPESETFNQIPIYPVTYRKKLTETEFANEFFEEKLFNYMDSLNVLYVALTRPVDRLIVFSQYKKNSKNNQNTVKTIKDALFLTLNQMTLKSDLLEKIEYDDKISFIADQGYDPQQFFKLKKHESTAKQITIDNYRINSWVDKTDIKLNFPNFLVPETLRQATERGLLMHQIMSQVRTMDDIPKAVFRTAEQGLIPNSQVEKITLSLEKMIRQAGVEDWFSDNWKVLTEETIILKDSGEELRPDRIIYNDQQVIVIDFKFAKPNKKHQQQIQQYVSILSEMFENKQVAGYLLYETGKVLKVEK